MLVNCQVFLDKNSLGLDIDGYDFRARHFGVYKVFENEETLIGGHRLVFDEKITSSQIIERIVDDRFGDFHALKEIHALPYYMFKLSKYKKTMMDFYEKQKAKGSNIVESSRFFVLKEERSLKLLESFILSAFTMAFNIYDSNYAITSCEKLFARLNTKFGFQLMPNTESEDINGLEAYNLLISRIQIPEEYKIKMQKMETAYLMTDQISFTPEAMKTYFPPDYRTPVYFRGIYNQVA